MFFKIKYTVVLRIIKYNNYNQIIVPIGLEGTLKGVRSERKILKIVRDVTLLTSNCSERGDMPIRKL